MYLRLGFASLSVVLLVAGLSWRVARPNECASRRRPVESGSSRPERYQPVICDRPTTQFPDFPETYLSKILVNLTSPDHSVTLVWAGPNADRGETGPFRSSPGAGLCQLNCDDPGISRMYGSKCTPKGTHVVQGYSCEFPGPSHTATYIDVERDIALHFHPALPPFPISNGCVHLDLHPARLIYDNSRRYFTEVEVSGQWSRGLECF